MVEAERDLNGLPREKLTEVLESFKDPDVFNAVTGPGSPALPGRAVCAPAPTCATTRWTWTSRAT